ncbi:MAG TPA: HDIG domain-containing protein, partial [Candidatus Paceibacterota bacterium]|nr:HDIG domain-containing protein [Candidatus Paceibacterota bacterium]
DPYNGQKDIKDKLVRAVGDAKERFSEDALRMMRAVRFATVLGFIIEKNTQSAIKANAKWIKDIAQERVRDEFIKIIDSPNAADGVSLLQEFGLLGFVLPELEKGVGVGQNKHHIYTVFEHNLYALKWSAQHNYPFHVKLASLLHDVGKPQTKRGDGYDSTFYGHEIVGARIARKALERLKFPKEMIEKIWLLVRYHLFYYNVDEVTESSVRRLVRNIGKENIEDLLRVRMADRIGSGVPKAEPYKLRHLRYVIERVQKDPISAKMLKINGSDIMKLGNIAPGPKVGYLLNILLGEVLEDPRKNTKKELEKRTKELLSLSEAELLRLSKKAKEAAQQVETKQDEMSKQKYWIS